MAFHFFEEKILNFWKKEKIFEKSVKKRKNKKPFIFFEGPPYANGKPGIHHLLARCFKDIILRYKSMQGFYVYRKAGWDTHGLPTEISAEKSLGIKSKKEIEKIGIENFIQECKKNIFTYKKEWEKFTERIGYWIDLKSAFVTCSPDYIESLWYILKKLFKKGLLIRSKKVVPWCVRCQTALSSHELSQGYRRIKEESIYFKVSLFQENAKVLKKLKLDRKRLKNKKVYFLVWTTTPWTLPGNVAIAVNPKFSYLAVKVKDEILILAKRRKKAIFWNISPKILGEFSGKEILGLKYLPLYKTADGPYKILAGDFVSQEEGTGLVHIAPAFGQEDWELIVRGGFLKEDQIPITLSDAGFLKNSKIAQREYFEKANKKIVSDLEKRGLLFKKEIFEHDYPFCWRCDSKLVYLAKRSWFIRMTKLKEKLLLNNQKINWIPSHLKEGRFGEWLKEVKDWNLSRQRFWGTPLPIWECQNCQTFQIIGSFSELEKKSGRKIKDPHRPFIDKIKIPCKKCKKESKRILEVCDVWFDSGAMPFAQWHYPFEKRDFIEKRKFFPADFICEGIDQTRGWFYTLLAISTALGYNFPPFRNVITTGIVLDEKGKKMSKSKGNIVDPFEIIKKYGADSARWYFYTINQPDQPKFFSEKDVKIAFRKFILTFWNSFRFFETYRPKKITKIKKEKLSLLDKWILSRLNSLIKKVTKNLDNYQIVESARLIEDFLISDLSLWYIRRKRSSFQQPSFEKELQISAFVLKEVLLTLAKLTSPFVPFISEKIYQSLTHNKKSVHLENWPKAKESLIDKKLEKKMVKARELVRKILAERQKKKIKIRQPLKLVKIKASFQKEILKAIKEEVNVKEIIVDKKIKKEILLDTRLSKELIEEGIVREFIRQVQQLRKEKGLLPKDKVKIICLPPQNIKKILKKREKEILTKTRSLSFNFEKPKILEKEIKLSPKVKFPLSLRLK